MEGCTYVWNGESWKLVARNCPALLSTCLEPPDPGTYIGEQVITQCLADGED
jgi:hypothetical protein